ncbi:putative Subtilisin-like serine protease 2 [Hibiscus syriacus]|uniref:Subtilisin-like serine protease 2 n=1 Tax=Hibiscus syriacus TaxID=106335 RepID=A0A6A2YE53_HIBSY|nr:putative Subtilisin-like serine protease 2 [Hibiscus syriacus]
MTRTMSFYSCSVFVLSWLLLLLSLPEINDAILEPEEHKTYIVQMDHPRKPPSFSTDELWNRSTLRSLSNPVDDEAMLLYSYNHVIRGFSARLTSSQLNEIEKSLAHLATYQESFGKLFTTHSLNFLELKRNFGLWSAASYGEGEWHWYHRDGRESVRMARPLALQLATTNSLVLGCSAKESALRKCENDTTFSPSACNNKLTGARLFSKGIRAELNIPDELDYDLPRDFEGHGTHTLSTAAGNRVLGVSHFGFARDTASGVAPHAHVAMYKVLWETDSGNSAASDVLAGMDQAIEDGFSTSDGTVHHTPPHSLFHGGSSTSTLTLQDEVGVDEDDEIEEEKQPIRRNPT